MGSPSHFLMVLTVVKLPLTDGLVDVLVSSTPYHNFMGLIQLMPLAAEATGAERGQAICSKSHS